MIERDHLGQPTRDAGARAVTPDGRLLYIGTIDGRHEFRLDGKILGSITLPDALRQHENSK